MSTAAINVAPKAPTKRVTAVGIPTEVKAHENRVGMTPYGGHEFVKKGHTVYVQAGAGVNSGFSDENYTTAGCIILPTAEAVYAVSDMIMKVSLDYVGLMI